MKDERLYVIHILECIERVERYTSEGKDSFFADTKTQDAVLRNLQTLAESTQMFSEATIERHPDVDWRAIAGFRNVLVHEYLGIDLNRVWDIVERDLPALKSQMEVLKQELGA